MNFLQQLKRLAFKERNSKDSPLSENNRLGFELIHNSYGWMHPLNEISQAFIDFSTKAPGLVIDMGAAYGVASIPILKKHIDLIACDVSQANLDELMRRISPSLHAHLQLKKGYFPTDFDFKKNSVGAILLSHILHFLSPDELDSALNKLSDWLAPNAKLFIICYSPYVSNMHSYIPVYEERLSRGIKWPYWRLNNMHDYFTLMGSKITTTNLPPTMNYLDWPLLTHALESRGFLIETGKYLDPERNHIPAMARLDGREWCGIIASKPN